MLKKMDHKILVLDTHIWIWLINGDKKIEKSNFLPHIDDAIKKMKEVK